MCSLAVEGTFLTLQSSFQTGASVLTWTVELRREAEEGGVSQEKAHAIEADLHESESSVELGNEIRICRTDHVHFWEPVCTNKMNCEIDICLRYYCFFLFSLRCPCSSFLCFLRCFFPRSVKGSTGLPEDM